MIDKVGTRDADGVIITGDLDRRPSRAPDYEAENRALTALADAMSSDPASVLQRLVETAMELTRSDSAGISLLESGGENGRFRWVATAGAWSPYRDDTMPRDASPCGEVIARETILLVKNPERSFPALGQAAAPIREGLLAPFHLRGEAIGTVWTVKHGPNDHFDAEDARLIQSLARFASAAQQMAQALRASDDRQAFFLRLSDTLRPLTDVRAIKAAAAAAVVEWLDVASAGYAEVEPDGLTSLITDEHIDGRIASLTARYVLKDFGSVTAAMARGETILFADLEEDGVSPDARAAFSAIDVRAAVATPLIKNGAMAAYLFVAHPHSRAWTTADLDVIQEVADRTWAAVERARAEARTRESEAKLRNLFDTMRQGYHECEMIRDAEGRATDYRLTAMNSSFEQLVGIPVADAIGRTAREIVPRLGDWWVKLFDEVVKAGEQRVHEYEVPQLGRWYRIEAYPKGEDCAAALFDDITERKLAEAALRESEARQAFFLKLSDALRPLGDPVAIQVEVMRVLGEHLKISRAFYSEVSADGDVFIPGRSYNDGVAPMPARSRLSDFGQFMRAHLESGCTLVVENALADDRYAADQAFEAIEVRAGLGVPLVKNGRLLAIVSVHQSTPRAWTQEEIALVEETAERTWAAVERARAETALRASEERFAQFASASASGLWIRDAATLAMEFVSPAVGRIYGVPRDAMLDGIENWAALIVPEDRSAAIEHIEQARQGETVVHEFRIQRPSDQSFRWIRNTDFPLGGNGHPERIGGIAEDVTEQKLATEYQGVLLLELQHRVRNIMAIIRSIVARTEDGAASVAEYAELLTGRLLALARVQALLTRSADAKIGLAGLVHDELNALAAHPGQFDLAGPDVELSPKAAETMTLAVHELTTNALKYGALGSRDGTVTVRWEVVDRRGSPWLFFRWVEAGAPPRPASASPRRVGFGSELIEGRIPYELRGHGKVTIEAGGARCDLEFPLKSGASVLETDAPKRATVFGGAMDMSGQADLSGQRVLVLEDDYYIAMDTARALRGVGAEVIGPCAREDDARDAMTDAVPTSAVVDINLGAGPSFGVARELKEAGVPMVFITGYDEEVISDDLAEVRRLQKPVQFTQIIVALAEAAGLRD